MENELRAHPLVDRDRSVQVPAGVELDHVVASFFRLKRYQTLASTPQQSSGSEDWTVASRTVPRTVASSSSAAASERSSFAGGAAAAGAADSASSASAQARVRTYTAQSYLRRGGKREISGRNG